MNDHEKHLKFVSKVSQNDTLQRRNRDLQINKHQHPSSSDEQDASPHRSSSESSSQPHLVNIYFFFYVIFYILLGCRSIAKANEIKFS
jgi:hypothetical protein